ncbi:MAG: NTP transferase domain-containing protein [Bacteroidota bacterium]
MKPALLILAAGLGSRYGSLKQMDRLGPNGESIIDYSVYDAVEAGFGKVVFVLREEIVDDFYEIFANRYKSRIEVDHVVQKLTDIPAGIPVTPDRIKPWGTGHAVITASEKFREPFAVINGDDYYGKDAFAVIARLLSSLDPADIAIQSMVGYPIANTLSEFGAVSRGICSVDGLDFLTGVVERTQIEHKNGKIIFVDDDQKQYPLSGSEVVSMNFWGFTPAFLEPFRSHFTNFLKEQGLELKSEYYIPYGVNQMIKSGLIKVKVLESTAQWFGVTYQADKPMVQEKLAAMHKTGIYPVKIW